MYRKIRACQYKFPSDFSIPEKLLIGGLLQVRNDISRLIRVLNADAAPSARLTHTSDWGLAREVRIM